MMFNSMDDVYKVIFQCYTECKDKGFNRVGEAIYEQSLMFVNTDKFLKQEHQLRIKEHQFCKDFNCPPFPSLDQTPANIVDDFMIIEREIKLHRTKDK